MLSLTNNIFHSPPQKLILLSVTLHLRTKHIIQREGEDGRGVDLKRSREDEIKNTRER